MLMTLLKKRFAFITQATVSSFLITICKCKQQNFVWHVHTHTNTRAVRHPEAPLNNFIQNNLQVYLVSPHVVDLSASKINTNTESFQHATRKQRCFFRSVITSTWRQKKIGGRDGMSYFGLSNRTVSTQFAVHLCAVQSFRLVIVINKTNSKIFWR
jgi:hypothetical protein